MWCLASAVHNTERDKQDGGKMNAAFLRRQMHDIMECYGQSYRV